MCSVTSGRVIMIVSKVFSSKFTSCVFVPNVTIEKRTLLFLANILHFVPILPKQLDFVQALRYKSRVPQPRMVGRVCPLAIHSEIRAERGSDMVSMFVAKWLFGISGEKH